MFKIASFVSVFALLWSVGVEAKKHHKKPGTSITVRFSTPEVLIAVLKTTFFYLFRYLTSTVSLWM
jgi:hypothetical protein